MVAAVTGAATFLEATVMMVPTAVTTVAGVTVQCGQQQRHCASAYSLPPSNPFFTLLCPDGYPERLTSVDHITGLSCLRLQGGFGHQKERRGQRSSSLLPSCLGPSFWKWLWLLSNGSLSRTAAPTVLQFRLTVVMTYCHL